MTFHDVADIIPLGTTTTACIVAFMNAKNFLAVLMYCEEKKQKAMKMYFLKVLAKKFLFMANLLPNGLHKCYIILLKVD